MTRVLKSRLFYLFFILVGIAIATLYALQQDNLLGKVIFYLQDSRQHGEQLRETILAKGAFAPLVFIGLQILQVIIAPIPGEATGVLGGYLFGALPSFAYSSIGLTIGSCLAFIIARLLSDLIRNRLEQSTLYKRFNHLVSKGDFVIPFVLFLLPGFPKDSLAYLLGMSHMPLPVFLFVTGVGRMPGTLLLSFQGAEIYQGNYLKLVLLLAFSALIAIPYAFYHKRLLAWLTHYSRRKFTNNDPNDPDPRQGGDSGLNH